MSCVKKTFLVTGNIFLSKAYSHSAKVLGKIDVEVDGVILSKRRIMRGMEFTDTAEVDVELGQWVSGHHYQYYLDRCSPLCYAIE